MSLFSPLPENTGWWTPHTAAGTPGVGIPGGFRQYTAGKINDRAVIGALVDLTEAPYNVVPYDGVSNGTTSIHTAINQAIIDAAGTPTVLYLPGGTEEEPVVYLLAGVVNSAYVPNITIRGDGPATIIFMSADGANGAAFGTPSPGDPNNFPNPFPDFVAKGDTEFDVIDASGYSVGGFCTLSYDDDEDDDRIIAGLDSVWSSLGFPKLRKQLCKIISKTSTHLTLDPPAPWGSEYVHANIGIPPTWSKTSGWGFEDFNVRFDSDTAQTSGTLLVGKRYRVYPYASGDDFTNVGGGNFSTSEFIATGTTPANWTNGSTLIKLVHPGVAIGWGFAEYSWFYNLHFENWNRNQANGSCIILGTVYRCEVSKCHFHSVDVASSDGCIQRGLASSCLIENNIFSGLGLDVLIYDSGASMNNVDRYNHCASPYSGTDMHNAHPMLNLSTYNYFPVIQNDGYHGSGSRNTIYRNLCVGYFELQLRINRMHRHDTVVGNIFGQDGVTSGTMTLGEPNFNRDSQGFSGPTGTSDQVGNVPYHNYPHDIGAYTIQPEDVFVGSFSVDWKVTGELIERISDTHGIFAMSGGRWFTGLSATGGAGLLPIGWWNNKANNISNGVVQSVDGLNVEISFNSGTLPTEGTVLRFHGGPASFQELDLDVKATMDLRNNYLANASGVGAISNPFTGGITLADDLTGEGQPDWWNEDGFTGPWPPWHPDNPDTFTADRLPARYRYSLVEPPSAPTFLSEVTISGEQVEGQTLTALGGLASGNPAPTYNFQWKRDGLDIVGETASTYLLVSEDIGTVISVVKTATNTEGSDTSTATTGEIQPYRGDILKITQVVNSSPITELRIINGVRSAINHSGNYPAAVDGWELVDTLTVQVPNVGHIPPIEVYSGTYIESQLP